MTDATWTSLNLLQVSSKSEPSEPIRALDLAWPANEDSACWAEVLRAASLDCHLFGVWGLRTVDIYYLDQPCPAQTSTTQSLRSFHLELRGNMECGAQTSGKYCHRKKTLTLQFTYLLFKSVLDPLSLKNMLRNVYQGQWKWLMILMWEEVNTDTLFTPAPETRGLHH